MALVACSECQSQVSDKAVTCPHCGNVFTRCPECRTEVESRAATCSNCGYPLALASTPQYAPQLLPDNKQQFDVAGAVAPLVYAGFWRRFVAALIDGIIVGVVLIICVIILGQILGSPSSAFITLSSVVVLGVGIAYFVGQESGSQQATIGKRALGIIVTDMHGHRVSGGRATGRYFGKILSGLILLIGYLMAAFTQKKQALHDMMAGTLVVVKPASR
jgi:uncharacterized RDD family membrane protein YckC/predicted RNA-binding Zn-ribbon protein involved in translation (DUF1610 family)